MAVITIPSSFSPIAAALDVFTQDRLAQQKRARQQEQDAWNREARGRQREGWGRQDEVWNRQDLLWQRQQDEYNKQQAKLAALGDATWQDKQIYNTGSYESPEYDKYRGAIGRSALGGQEENVPTVAPEQMQIANAFERAMASKRMANTHGVAPMTAGKIHAGQPQEFDQEALREAIFTYRNSEPGSVSRSMAFLALKDMGLSAGHINEIAGPETAAQFNAEEYSRQDALFRGGLIMPPETMGDEDAMYDDTDVVEKLTEQQRLNALLARDKMVGRTTSRQDLESIFNPQAPKVKAEKITPLQGWTKAYGNRNDRLVHEDDVMAGISSAMQKALLGSVPEQDPDNIESFSMSELFSDAQEQQLMSNMWQAAQMIQQKYFPGKSPQIVFEEMKAKIGMGPEELDLVDTSGTISEFVPGKFNDTEAKYIETPRLYNAQQIMDDYLKTLPAGTLPEDAALANVNNVPLG